MKKYILKLMVFGGIIAAVLWTLDAIVTKGLKKSYMPLFCNMTKINNGEINADIIINGSSKALVQINPFIIDSVTKLSTYNLALDGTPFIPQKTQYDLYKRYNNRPKVIIQVVSAGTLRNIDSGFKDAIKFAPYMANQDVSKMLKSTSHFNILDEHIPMLKYLGRKVEIFSGIFSFFNVKLFSSDNNKGYSPRDREWTDSFNRFKKTGQTIKSRKDPLACQIFEDYLIESKNENVKMVLVYPPVYLESISFYNEYEVMISYYKNIAKKHNVLFLDYSQFHEISPYTKYFYNSQHLNKKGADLFSKRLSADIKNFIQD